MLIGTAASRLGAEQSTAAGQPGLAAAQRRYALAAKALEQCNDQLGRLRCAGDTTAAMEALDVRNKAAKAHAEARTALVDAGWSEGALARAERLGEAVEGLLRAARR